MLLHYEWCILRYEWCRVIHHSTLLNFPCKFCQFLNQSFSLRGYLSSSPSQASSSPFSQGKRNKTIKLSSSHFSVSNLRLAAPYLSSYGYLLLWLLIERCCVLFFHHDCPVSADLSVEVLTTHWSEKKSSWPELGSVPKLHCTHGGG